MQRAQQAQKPWGSNARVLVGLRERCGKTEVGEAVRAGHARQP